MARDDMFSGQSAERRSRLKKVRMEERLYDIVTIPVTEIRAPAFHDRSYISPEGIDELAENIQQIGHLIEPIVVRRLDDDQGYERIAGYRRIEAVKKLGWDKITARVLDVSKDEAILIMLSENLQRENLNAYDETFSIVQFLSISLGHENTDDTIALFYRIKNFHSGNIQGDDALQKTIDEITAILDKLGKFKLGGLIDRLKVLSVDAEIIAAMREDNLSYSSAVLINQVSFDRELMQTLIALVLRGEISYSLLKDRVREERRKKGKVKTETDFTRYSKRFKAISKSINNKAFKGLDAEKKEKLFQLLEAMEQLIAEE